MPKLDLAKLKSRLVELRERYDLLKSWQSATKEEFLEDPKINRAVLRVFQEAIEACISMASMIIAAQGYGKPSSYAEAFRLLGQHGVVDRRFSQKLEEMARFRNLIVHVYWEMDLEEVYSIFKAHVEDFKRFESQILKFVEQLPED